MNEKPSSFEFVMWSSAKHRTIEALVDEYSDYVDGLEVMLHREENEADPEAVAVVCKLLDDENTNRQILGGDSRYLDEHYCGQRVGYVARKDLNKSALARDEFEQLPIRALLRYEKHPERALSRILILEPHWPVQQEDTSDPDYLPF